MPELIFQCHRCGMTWEDSATRKNSDLCQSCRARKTQKVDGCIVWHGHFAEDMVTPIDDEGNEVLPGKRRCKRLDCVAPNHIERKVNG